MRFLIGLVIALALCAGGLFALDRYFPEQATRWGMALERSQSKLEERTLKIPGFEIAYLEGGSGEPLVLVHGIGADKDNFTRAARWLTPHYRVIAIDLPGFGQSSKPEQADYGIPAQVERLDEIMQALKLPRAHFGGSSMGGWIIASYAAKYPDKAASLWLLGAAGTDGASAPRCVRPMTGANTCCSRRSRRTSRRSSTSSWCSAPSSRAACATCWQSRRWPTTRCTPESSET